MGVGDAGNGCLKLVTYKGIFFFDFFFINFSLKRGSDEVLANAVEDLGERWGQVPAGCAEQPHPKVTCGITRAPSPCASRCCFGRAGGRGRWSRLWHFISLTSLNHLPGFEIGACARCPPNHQLSDEAACSGSARRKAGG